MISRKEHKSIITNSYAEDEPKDKYKYAEKGDVNKGHERLEKIFTARNSLLTDLYEDKNIKAIYNVWLSMLTGFVVTTAVDDYLHKGQILLTFPLIYSGFSNLHTLFLLWCLVFASTLMVYFGFKFWALIRIQSIASASQRMRWDYLCLALFISYCPTLMYFSTYAAMQFDCGIAELTIYYSEVTRFLMKVYAFVRSNAPRALNYKGQGKSQMIYPEFSAFLYYMFAPTFIYRDEYPRSTHIRWKFVFTCFTEVIGVTFFVSFVIHRYTIGAFKDYGLKILPWQRIVVSILELTGIYGQCIVAMNYAVVHSWQNAFAEMLRFSDRLFYKDWWTATDVPTFFRRWSLLVHEWLHTYFYRDIYKLLKRNKTAAAAATFIASFLFHDYFMGFSFHIYKPIISLTVPIMISIFFIKIRNNTIGSVFIWYGNAFLFTAATNVLIMEYYSTINCPNLENLTFFDYIVPKLIRCYK